MRKILCPGKGLREGDEIVTAIALVVLAQVGVAIIVASPPLLPQPVLQLIVVGDGLVGGHIHQHLAPHPRHVPAVRRLRQRVLNQPCDSILKHPHSTHIFC